MTEPVELDEKTYDKFQFFMEMEFNESLYFLGATSVDEYTPPDVSFSYDYYEMGLRLWLAFENELYKLICDSGEKKPKLWVNELIGGDIRNLATGLILAVHTDLGVSLGIAAPAAALLIKRGILVYCENGPKFQPVGTVQEILQETKEMVEEDLKDDMESLEEYFRKQQKNKVATSKKKRKKKSH